MKISQLIAKLEEMKTELGDVPVEVPMNDLNIINPVESVKVNSWINGTSSIVLESGE